MTKTAPFAYAGRHVHHDCSFSRMLRWPVPGICPTMRHFTVVPHTLEGEKQYCMVVNEKKEHINSTISCS